MISKLTFLLSAIMATSILSEAQTPSKIDQDRVFDPTSFDERLINLNKKAPAKLYLPSINRIQVMDMRADSFSIGFRKRMIEIKKQKFGIAHGLKEGLQSFLAENSTTSQGAGEWNAILAVRKFWLKEVLVDEDEDDKIQDNRPGEIRLTKTEFTAIFDVYLNRDDTYFAAYRFDTIATAFLNINEFARVYLEDIILNSIKKLAIINPETIATSKKKLTQLDIRGYYESRWDKKILTEPVVVKGVYQTFKEFLENSPSYRTYELKKNKLTDIIYLPDANNNFIPSRNIWGYSDGKYLFIRSGDNYYPLVRVQNGFYFMGSKELSRLQPNSQGYDPYTGRTYGGRGEVSYRNILRPYKLDLETGEIL